MTHGCAYISNNLGGRLWIVFKLHANPFKVNAANRKDLLKLDVMDPFFLHDSGLDGFVDSVHCYSYHLEVQGVREELANVWS